MDDVEHEDDPNAASDDDKNYDMKTQEQQYAIMIIMIKILAT